MLSIGIPKLEGRLDERFNTVLARIERYAPEFNREMLELAYQFASRIHEGQFRRSGEPFIIHPLEVAFVLAELEMDETTIAAALLHDTIEDGFLEREDGDVTAVTRDDLAQRFGDEVAGLAEGVTKLGAIHITSREERQAENLRKMLLATARDIRVILIKLADRFHNMRTIRYLPEPDQRRIADETMHIFAPIAHRLGVWKIKWELEDLSLRVLEPEVYREIQMKVNRTRAEREEVVSTAIDILQTRLGQIGIQSDIVGRPKHFYSIYLKMKSQDVDFNQILDLEAVRVIVNTVQECYAVLGEVHNRWLPLPNMFTDYIAKPKPNLYQSLHTKVIGPHGQPLEVQIRTWEMHRTAEVGIAAHWRYKEGAVRDVEFERKVAWLRSLLEMQAEAKTETDWLDALKVNLFKDQVFVFTPAGDIIDLPAGSTPIDFAYRIHTDLGAKCAGAKVNGRLVPLTYQFQNGDVAEIIVRANQKPSLDWLNIVGSSHARNKIKAWFRKQNREENIQRGRQALEEECRRVGVPAADILRQEKLLEIANKANLVTVDDLYALIGYGEMTAEGVVHRIREDLPKRSLDELHQLRPPAGARRAAHSGRRLRHRRRALQAVQVLPAHSGRQYRGLRNARQRRHHPPAGLPQPAPHRRGRRRGQAPDEPGMARYRRRTLPGRPGDHRPRPGGADGRHRRHLLGDEDLHPLGEDGRRSEETPRPPHPAGRNLRRQQPAGDHGAHQRAERHHPDPPQTRGIVRISRSSAGIRLCRVVRRKLPIYSIAVARRSLG